MALSNIQCSVLNRTEEVHAAPSAARPWGQPHSPLVVGVEDANVARFPCRYFHDIGVIV